MMWWKSPRREWFDLQKFVLIKKWDSEEYRECGIKGFCPGDTWDTADILFSESHCFTNHEDKLNEVWNEIDKIITDYIVDKENSKKRSIEFRKKMEEDYEKDKEFTEKLKNKPSNDKVEHA